MYKKAMISLIGAIFLLAAVVGLAVAQGNTPPSQGALTTFERLALDVALMDRFYSGGNGIRVIFDSQAASHAGFSADSIALAQEMANFTNDLVKPSSGDVSIQGFDINMEISAVYIQNRYPNLAAFYATANAFASQESEIGSSDVSTEGYTPPAYLTCGWYTSPRPNRGAPYKYYTSSNPVATLKSWGYHKTPEHGPGGGWTRDQTYRSDLCGYNTYRDHANIDLIVKTKFWEQSYRGFTPRGEPNPELWRVGPWPYPTWPVYNYWWHDTH